MHPLLAWGRFLAVAAGYAAAFFTMQRVTPFSVTSPWFVFVAMVCVLGLAFVAQPIVMIRMPGPLRVIRAWEAGGRAYRALGVTAYGRLLRRTPLRLFNVDVYLRNGLRDWVNVGAELEAAEASHFWAAVLVAPYTGYLIAHGMWAPLLWITLAQMFINVYPIMHLRLTRHRLGVLVSERFSRRQARATPAG
jgi:hypothetical protein